MQLCHIKGNVGSYNLYVTTLTNKLIDHTFCGNIEICMFNDQLQSLPIKQRYNLQQFNIKIVSTIQLHMTFVKFQANWIMIPNRFPMKVKYQLIHVYLDIGLDDIAEKCSLYSKVKRHPYLVLLTSNHLCYIAPPYINEW